MTLITIQAAHTIDLAIALLGGLTDMTALASTQYPEIRIGEGNPQPRRTSDHLMIQGRVSRATALLIEVAGGRVPDSPFCFEIIGETGVLALEGGAPRGFQSGRLRLLLDGMVQSTNEDDLASLPDAALNVAATFAQLRDDIAKGTSTVPSFQHAVRLAQLIEDAAVSSRTGLRRASGNWPSA